ncbi:CHAP domain-containing protein [Kitasatospora acidiphila]|uniref:CHAP domain-containing protein n=1 Tax=Kitasatospora acidiphila TaxID=2567942 RepID=A0A540W0H2_9ACTN|nr:CHAP domain-containing protein [Kitasatospora acidiphila]TQF02481.1 CHAP domain-containing protein [Kitasatospora acidiphila]
MNVTRLLHRISGAAAVLLMLGFVSLAPVTAASAATGADVASLATANITKTAGTCANNPTYNSLGGSEFEHSCDGNNGTPEYWCADFAMWVWQNAGYYTGGLDAGAASFYTYGQNNGTLHTGTGYTPQVGDAVEYGSTQDSEIHHVGIVTAVNADGSVDTVNGDWGGTTGTGSMAGFAVSSSVVKITLPAGQTSVGSVPSTVDTKDGYKIVGYTTPVTGSGSFGTNPYTAPQVCGSGYGIIDSHDLGSATVFLLYNGSTGSNCVTTLVKNPSGPVALNANLTVQGGSPVTDTGTYTDYAGPVSAAAANSCVQWGGSYAGTSWTSPWGHCGTGAPTPSPATGNPYTAGQVCGSGYTVTDSHALGNATVYLLYNSATGNNCVTTLADNPSGAVSMNATLAVQGGSSGSNPGSFTYYAGPVVENAPTACVMWGGGYGTTSWTSPWSHCG